MKLPDGHLVRSRVVDDPRLPLADALDRELTGYAVLQPQDTLLLDEGGSGILTFRDGTPIVAYHTGSRRGGPQALADLAVPGPYHVDLYAVDADELAPIHDEPDVRVPPGMPAERLAGDPALAASTRRAAPERDCEPVADDGTKSADDDTAENSAVEAFLDDEAKVKAIRERAREEATERAEEWGFDTA